MNAQTWEKICGDTVNTMIQHVAPYLTPISYEESPDYGRHYGSGSYFETEGEKFLITNEHVARKVKEATLASQFLDNDNIIRLTNHFHCENHPIDLAISKIDSEIWSHHHTGSKAIPLERFAKQHNPVSHELLFFAGYSGERSTFRFGHLFTRGTPYLTQESPFPQAVSEGDPDCHFSLFYPPDLAESVDGTSHLPDPHGFSGSLVWDTKRVACLLENKAWEPSMAEVTGIVWGWPSSSACILATKVDKLMLPDIIYNYLKNK
ncbi:hypothetical protein R3C64_000711 [Salmonella enterica]|nr:hypothetical protein [Salmonella enterica]ELJ9674869.1 hypothetical protein [Salmonella enterica]ELQ9129324.1 hypothetical protein [Salmonella enterica]